MQTKEYKLNVDFTLIKESGLHKNINRIAEKYFKEGFSREDLYTNANSPDDLKAEWIVFNFKNKEVLHFKDNILKKISFKDWAEVKVFLDNLKKLYKNSYRLKEDTIKRIEFLINSFKPSKIKELSKGETLLKKGCILYTSWGYDQTNVELFRVVKFLGKNYFIIQELEQNSVKGSEGFMSCSVEAGKEDLNELPLKAFIDNSGRMSICENGYKRGLYIDEGKKHYKSWYA